MMNEQIAWHGRPIHSWSQFHQIVKQPRQRLLERLDDYDDTILVAGCQRSGTTAITRLLRRAPGLADHCFGSDDELDGALLLAGYVDPVASGRHCFQTTYLNDRYPEYFEHGDFRLVWILREPRSVVYSMLNNWKRGALNRLYDACGRPWLDAEGLRRPGLRSLMTGSWAGPSRVDKACASYVAKTMQTFALRERLGSRMLIVDYDDLVLHRTAVLLSVCEFAGVPFETTLLGYLHGRSARRDNRLTEWQTARVDHLCAGAYRDARGLLSTGHRA
jgi:Sulfotransferase domain